MSSLSLVLLGQLRPENQISLLKNLTDQVSKHDDDRPCLAEVELILQILDSLKVDDKQDLNFQEHRAESQSAVLCYILAYLNRCIREEQNQDHVTVAKICLKHPATAAEVIRECLRSLALRIVEHVNDPSGFETLNHNNVVLVNRILENVPPQPQLAPPLNCESALAFLKSILLSVSGPSLSLNVHDLFTVLATLVGVNSVAVSQNSLEVLLVLLRLTSSAEAEDRDRQTPQNGSDLSLARFAWQTILELTTSTEKATYVTAGYTLWSRVLSCGIISSTEQMILRQVEYWLQIQAGVADGSSERQKISLNLLQQSLLLLTESFSTSRFTFDIKVKAKIFSQYAKFSTVTETLIISRSLNQIKDCLQELLIIAGPDSAVDKSWIVALLTATLRHGVQDSIRKILGSWVMLYGCQVLAQSPQNAGTFIENIFLPWATIGHHFTSTIHRNTDRSLVCEHGERLANFLKSLLISVARDRGNRVASYVNGIFQFLRRNVGRLYPFTRAFVLEGLVDGLESIKYSLNSEELGIVLNFYSTGTLHEIVRDVMIVYCARICSLANPDISDPISLKLITIQRASREILNPPSKGPDRVTALSLVGDVSRGYQKFQWAPPTKDQDYTIGQFTTWLQSTQNTCLHRDGLLHALSFLHHALCHQPETDMAIDEVLFALRAVWDEIEIQDYPKRPLIDCSLIFFHENVLLKCTDSSELSELVCHIAFSLQKLARNRVHVWSSLACAIREAFLVAPNARKLLFSDFYQSFVSNPPVTREDFEFEAIMAGKLNVPGHSYYHYYGHREGFGYASAIDALNRLPVTKESYNECLKLLNSILEPWLKQKPPVPVHSAWKTTVALQVTLIIMEKIVSTMDEGLRGEFLKSFLTILSLEPLPRYRYLLEWIVVRIYLREPGMRAGALDLLNELDGSNPKHSVSVMKICLMIACLPDSDEAFAMRLMTCLIPLSGSQKIIIRHEAQWTFPWLWDEVVNRNWVAILKNPAFQSLNEYIRSLDSYKNPHPWRLKERFDPIRDHNLTNLFQGEYLTIEPSEEERTTKNDFIQVSVLNMDRDIGEFPPTIPLGEARFQKVYSLPKSQDGLLELQALSASEVPLQTKSSVVWKSSDYSSENLTTLTSQRRVKDVIVIASFIDNPYNLGGISRVAEIFGAKSLQLPDIRVAKNKDFVSVAVSSHTWLPIEELQPNDVPEYLRRRKLDGYSIIGIEQTDRSKILGQADWQLPSKIILVLGSEKQGIPAKLLADMDHCVEVQQLGVTRSMNVQTAAAVVLYEYSRQHASLKS